MKQFSVNDSVDLSDMTKHKSVPEACVVDGIPNGRISFPELLPHILEDILEQRIMFRARVKGSRSEQLTRNPTSKVSHPVCDTPSSVS